MYVLATLSCNRYYGRLLYFAIPVNTGKMYLAVHIGIFVTRFDICLHHGPLHSVILFWSVPFDRFLQAKNPHHLTCHLTAADRSGDEGF